MPTPSPRRRRSAGPGRLTLSEIAGLAGVSVKTLRNRIIPNDDPVVRQFWVQALDLRKRKSGLHGLIHGDAALVQKHMPDISGVDAPL